MPQSLSDACIECCLINLTIQALQRLLGPGFKDLRALKIGVQTQPQRAQACVKTFPLARREMMHFLHSESLCSESFATKTAFVFGCLSQLEVDGVKCRAVYLRKIQTEFTAASVSSCQYHNLIVLLCQVFRRVRIADGTTISALCSPILQGLKALLDEEDEEAALVFSQQVQIVGPELARLQPDKFAELLLRLREKLFQGTCTRRARASLLAVLELSLNPDWRLNGNNVRELFEKESVSLPQPMEISRPPILSPPSEPHSHRHHQQPHKQSSPKGPSLFRNMPPTSNASPPSCGRIGDGFTRRTHWSSPPSSTSTTTTTTTSDSHQWGQISPSCYGGVSWIGKDTQENKNKTSFRIGTWTAEEERRKDENVPERQQLSSRTTDDEDDW